MPGVSSSFIYNGSVERSPGGAQRGEETGEVFCPPRMAHIAVMRCGEYQEQFGCKLGCPNAATPAQIWATQMALKEDSHMTWRRKYAQANAVRKRCPECGNVKGDATSRLCSTCRSEYRHARRPNGSIAHYDHCRECGNPKSNNPSPRCSQCAQERIARRA